MNSWELFKEKRHDKVLLLGHRGSPLRERENTISSFKAALKEGADGVELDVRPTLDNHLVVSHDNLLSRVYGLDIKVEDTTLSELREKAPEIPLLSEVFDALGNVWYDIEVKADKPFGFRKEVVTLLWEELQKRKDLWDKIMISSFNPWAMRMFGKLSRNVLPLGIIYAGGGSVPKMCRKGQGRLVFKCAFLKPKWDIAEREKKSKPKFDVCPWTVDKEETIREMLTLDIPLIISNDPLTALRILQEENRR